MKDQEDMYECTECMHSAKLKHFMPTEYNDSKKDYSYQCPCCGSIDKIQEML